MVYEFKCEKCAVVHEVNVPLSDADFGDHTCPFCGGNSKYKYSLSSVSTSNMGNRTLDVMVGKSASERWQDIIHRQEIRDKVRQERMVMGLSERQRNDFSPIPSTVSDLRSRIPSQK